MMDQVLQSSLSDMPTCFAYWLLEDGKGKFLWITSYSLSTDLILLKRFFDTGRRWEPLQSDPSGPVTDVASSPLSDTLHSNSTSSSSPRLRNPDIWITLWKNYQHHMLKRLIFRSNLHSHYKSWSTPTAIVGLWTLYYLRMWSSSV
jgi:hypothetical protein